MSGPQGDLCDDFLEHLLDFAEARVAKEARARGWEAGGG